MKRTGLIVALVAVVMVVLGSGAALAVAKAGTIGNDRIKGTAQADVLSGGAGNDTLNGSTGNDKLFDGSGVDTVVGGDGADFLNTLDLQGGDKLNCGPGVDKAVADWNDVIQASCRNQAP